MWILSCLLLYANNCQLTLILFFFINISNNPTDYIESFSDLCKFGIDHFYGTNYIPYAEHLWADLGCKALGSISPPIPTATRICWKKIGFTNLWKDYNQIVELSHLQITCFRYKYIADK